MNAPPPVTLINVFIVDPDKQDELVDLLARATEASVCQAPGFISATLHRSLDGTKVTMYARWQSNEHYQAMRKDPGPLPFLEEALTFASFEPGMYEIVKSFEQVDCLDLLDKALYECPRRIGDFSPTAVYGERVSAILHRKDSVSPLSKEQRSCAEQGITFEQGSL